MSETIKGVEIKELHADDSIKAAKETTGADLYVKTGKTGGRRFLVSVKTGNGKPAMIALHL